jgi:hypothetical protein
LREIFSTTTLALRADVGDITVTSTTGNSILRSVQGNVFLSADTGNVVTVGPGKSIMGQDGGLKVDEGPLEFDELVGPPVDETATGSEYVLSYVSDSPTIGTLTRQLRDGIAFTFAGTYVFFVGGPIVLPWDTVLTIPGFSPPFPGLITLLPGGTFNGLVGSYEIKTSLYFFGFAVDTALQLHLYKNGSPVITGEIAPLVLNASSINYLNYVIYDSLAADVWSFQYTHVGGNVGLKVNGNALPISSVVYINKF